MANITDFLALVRTRGLSFRQKYEVKIFGPNVNNGSERDISLLCEDASIPGVIVGTRTVRLHNLNVQRPSTIDYMGQSSTFTFLIDNAWTARSYFDTWIEKIFDTSREVNQYIDIIGTIEVVAVAETAYTDTNRDPLQLYGVVLEEAFPKGMSLMPVSYGANDVHRLTVEFAFRRWRRKDVRGFQALPPSTDPVDAPQGAPALPTAPSRFKAPSLPKVPKLPSLPTPPSIDKLIQKIRQNAATP